MMKTIITLLLCIGLLAAQSHADQIEVIELQNRPASELIPILEPMLDKSGSLSGQGFQLIVRTTDENLEQIRQLVRKLDTAAKQLAISVFQGSDRDLRALSVGGGFEYQSDDVNASVGDTSTSRGGGSVSYSTRGATVSGNTLSTRGRLSDNPIHQLKVTEGTEGYIETGQSIPYFSGGAWLGGRRDVFDAGVEYKDVNTGFYVLPRVHGTQVTMEVSPYKQGLSKSRPGAVNTQSASTTVTGPLGQWLQIGGVTDQTSRSSSSIGTHASTQGRKNDSIWIKAELVP